MRAWSRPALLAGCRLAAAGIVIMVCPWTEAAAWPVSATAGVVGAEHGTGSTNAPVSSSGSKAFDFPQWGETFTSSGKAVTDPRWRQIHLSSTLAVTHSVCGGVSCQVGGAGVTGGFGRIQDIVGVNSASLRSGSLIDIYFNPVHYNGTVSFADISGFANGSVFADLSVSASVPSLGSASDHVPMTFTLDAGLQHPFIVAGQSKGMVLRVPNGGNYDLDLSFSLALQMGRLGVAGGQGGNASGSMVADFSHTVDWGGVAFATDALTGRRLTDLQLTSSMGVDWTQPGMQAPVPEPARVWLLLAGMMSGIALARRRHNRGCLHM